jgi:nucleoside-diphosphate-sugar epimerase
MKKEKVLICGATGFIGRNIVDRFSKRNDVELYGTYLNSKPPKYENVKMVKTDLTNKADVDRVLSDIDVVIQAAATTSGAMEIVNKPYYHVTNNAIMNSLIFRAAFEHKVSRVIFFSCTVMYQSGEVGIKEADFDANAEMYPNYFGVGWTKVYIEKMCEFYSRIGPTKYTAIRHSNIYGPWDKFDLEKSHVFGATMTKVLTTKDGRVVVWGTGEEERDLLYISDLVDFVELALERQKTKFEIYNVGLGQAISVSDLVKKMIVISGKNITVEYDLSKPSLKTMLFLNTAKAEDELGWAPRIGLDEGIRKTMDWYHEHIL